MKLDKAIEILDDLAIPGEMLIDSVDVDAIRLGIEALKLLQENRYYAPPVVPHLLPGETEE